MKEYALLFGKSRTLVGIVCHEDVSMNKKDRKIGVLLLNAGLIHRIGPNRLYVRLARRLAQLGHPVMRYDMSGIGDSRNRTDAMNYESVVLEEGQEAMRCLRNQLGVERYILMGVCSGASASFIIAEKDPLVIGAVLINPQAPQTEQTNQMQLFNYYAKQALFSKESWFKLLTIRSSFKTIWRAVTFKIKKRFVSSGIDRAAIESMMARSRIAFDTFRHRKCKLLFISAENEIGYNFIRKLLEGQFISMEAKGLMMSKTIKDADHNFMPIKSQKHVIDTIAEWILAFDEKL